MCPDAPRTGRRRMRGVARGSTRALARRRPRLLCYAARSRSALRIAASARPRHPRAARPALNLVYTDVGEAHVLNVENGVLHHWQREADPDAAVTVELTRGVFLKMVTRQVGLRELIFSDDPSTPTAAAPRCSRSSDSWTRSTATSRS